jgi:hypothetical protein
LDGLAHEAEELTRVRGARVLARVLAYRLAHGRSPASLEEALGRAAGSGEADPYDGRPLELEIAEDGVVKVTARRSRTGVGD